MNIRLPNQESHHSSRTLLLVWLGFTLGAPAAEFIVGPGHHETLQGAVDAAADAGNLDVENFIHIREPVLFTSARVRIGPEFSDNRQLTIRPDPSVPDLPRVTIVSQNGLQEILLLEGAGRVTVQDLDLIRHTTNAENLMEILHGANIVVQRCRIGSDWSSASLGEWSNLAIDSPQHVVVRNCVCFSRLPANLARGVVVTTGTAQNHSVFLYNNVVADFGVEGIQVAASGDSFVLLRNNVVLNHISLTPEPKAYHSAIAQDVILVTSHNAAFAGTAEVELLDLGAQPLTGGANFLRRERHEHVQAFREFEWKTDLGWNQNRNLFRLIDGGSMHNAGADAGVTVTDGGPHGRDVEVLDDWELDPRPAGQPPRTDRGADQYRVSLAGDFAVVQPGIRSFDAPPMSTGSGEGYEVIAVGPQDDFPDIPIVMSGGEYRISGDFVSVADTISIGDMPRSTRYDGTVGAFVLFPATMTWDATLAMTVEAWVFREDTNRVETIMSHDRSRSFWFGFDGPWLRFQRGPGQAANSTRAVLARRWTHVAAAYDGSRVRFYIDGENAGIATLGAGPSRQVLPLSVGGDPAGLNLLGRLDEVRLWSIARSPADIRGSMFVEIPRAPGLVLALPSGADLDSALGLAGHAGPGTLGERLGEFPRSLEIPRALWAVQCDGQAHLDSEYLGAEQVAIHYDDGTDAVACLVYRDRPGDRNLYVGIVGLHDVPAGRARSNSWVAVTIDADRSLDLLANLLDFQLRAPLSGDRAQLWVGDGQGNYQSLNIPPGPEEVWDAAYDWPNEFGPPTMEFRIGLELLGSWTDTDGMMFGHYDVTAAGDNYLAPNGSRWNSPATWPAATYVQNSVILPTAILEGYVYDNDASQPVGNHGVFLKVDQTGETLTARTTDSHGYFSFNVSVPPERPLRLEIDSCLDCLYLRSDVSPEKVQPITNFATTVIYPAAVSGVNEYASVDFYLRTPIGPIALTSYSPTEGVPRLRLRDSPEKLIPEDVATRVTIAGTNLHQGIQVFLYSCLNLPPENLANGGCLLNRDYFEARITDRAPDDSWVRVEVPHVPRPVLDSPWPGPWGWAVKDNWLRPDRGDEWRRLGGFVGTNFSLRLPWYPLVSGFEFDNEEFDPDWEDFAGVFLENAYTVCLRDVGYELFFPVFELLTLSSGGSCVGMASTSLQFHRQELDAEDNALLFMDNDVEGVHFAAGFARQGRGHYIDRFCEPYRPKNVRAHIRVNHGVQFSAEFIQSILDQMEGGLSDRQLSVEGDPALVLERVRNNPGEYIITMVPEIGSGHAVTPYAVVDGINGDDELDPGSAKILVYDNNYPEDTNRFIEITPRADRSSYRFPRDADIDDPDTRWDDRWSGRGIYAIPIDVFTREHTMPGVDEAGEFVILFTLGEADGYYTDNTGGEWGWRADGTLVDRLPGARSITPIGGPNTSTRDVMLLVPATNPPPSVQINVRSSHYLFHAGNAGRLLQLERYDGVPGDTDQARVLMETGHLAGLRYTPRNQAEFALRAMCTPAAGQRVVFELAGVAIPANAAGEFRLLNETRGLEFRNDTGSPAQPRILARWSDSVSGHYGVNPFGPFDVPAGAIQKVFIHDWPLASQLRSEIDLNRDGTPDQVQIYNRNELTPLWIQASVEGGQLVLTWPLTTFSVLVESAPTLVSPVSWTPLMIQREVKGQTVRATLPFTDTQRFFRLRY